MINDRAFIDALALIDNAIDVLTPELDLSCVEVRWLQDARALVERAHARILRRHVPAANDTTIEDQLRASCALFGAK